MTLFRILITKQKESRMKQDLHNNSTRKSSSSSSSSSIFITTILLQLLLLVLICLDLNGGRAIVVDQTNKVNHCLQRFQLFHHVQAFTSISTPRIIVNSNNVHTTLHTFTSRNYNKNSQHNRNFRNVSKHDRINNMSSLLSLGIATSTTKDQISHFNDFKPSTMTLTQSMIFFTKYLVQQLKEDHIKKYLTKQGKKRLLSKFRRSIPSMESYNPKLVQRLKDEIAQEEAEKKPLRETISTLNRARKEMTALVGYDAALLIPCFGFAGLAAFMNSVIPHYYGLCINCLANAAGTTQHDVVRAITGLAGASFLCAVFTGVRGALFWLAGKYISALI